MNISSSFYALLAIILLSGCLNTEQKVSGRWYAKSQVEIGHQIFQQNCASCHGKNGAGATNWRKPDTQGIYPPPPLNGTGHTWHHPMIALKRTIRNGGMSIGGVMPPFKDVLSNKEIEMVIAYIQSTWSPDVYRTWESRVNR